MSQFLTASGNLLKTVGAATENDFEAVSIRENGIASLFSLVTAAVEPKHMDEVNPRDRQAGQFVLT